MGDEDESSADLELHQRALVRVGLESLFEDQTFSGDLMTRLMRLGMCEEDMDHIFKRAEDDIIGFVSALTEAGAGAESGDALSGFIVRLKRQILQNPTIYVEGS